MSRGSGVPLLCVTVLALLLGSSGGSRSAFAQEQRSPYAGEERIEDGMHEAAVRLGREILELEEALDRLFAVGPADPSEVERLAGRIGQRSGLLRAVHLLAHLETAVVLRPAQIRRYGVLRGYQDAADPRHEPGHEMGEHEPQHRPR